MGNVKKGFSSPKDLVWFVELSSPVLIYRGCNELDLPLECNYQFSKMLGKGYENDEIGCTGKQCVQNK